MDPISAAASVVGLLGAASKISESLIKFVRSVRDAPQLAQTVLLEVSDVSACLSQLQRYVLGSRTNSRSRDDLLTVDQFVVALSNCVLIFSELEELVHSLKLARGMQPGRVARWMLKERQIQALLQRLNSSQVSLNLMLTTITCASVEEALSSMERLTSMMTKLIESDEDMSHRMTNMELRTRASLPGNFPVVNALDKSINRSASSPKVPKDDESIITIRRVESNPSLDEDDTALPSFDHSFDQDLHSSRPYTRASRRPPVWSVASSAVQTLSWSCLSGLSLADMSQISVINLPITPRELWNGQRYSVYIGQQTGLDKIVEEGPRPGSASPVSSRSPAKNRSSSLLNLKRFFRTPSPTSSDPQTNHVTHDENDTASNDPKRIALLGAPFSGKATICKHLVMLKGEGCIESDRLEAREWIIYTLIDAFRIARVDLGRISPGVFLETLDSEPFDMLDLATENDFMAKTRVRDKILSEQNAISNERIPFFMDNIDQIFKSNNAISDSLVLRARNKTTGNDSQPVTIDNIQCVLYNVGSSRTQPRKRAECFERLDSMIYVVSLISYCQQSLEGDFANQMEQALAEFESLTKVDRYNKLPIIVLLNKIDLLERQILQRPVSDYISTCPKNADYMTACRYFSDQFARLDERPNGVLHVCATSAVDRLLFEKTLTMLQPILTRNRRPRSSTEPRTSRPELMSTKSEQDTVEMINHLILAADLSPGRTHSNKFKPIPTQPRTPSPQVKTLQPFHIPTYDVQQTNPPD